MKKILIFLLLVGTFFVISLISEEPYINWFLNSKFEIASARIEQIMDKDGTFKVHEIITYNMRKPFRGVYRYIPPERSVEISDIKVWTEGIETKHVELEKTNKSFSARVWLVPFGSSQQLDPKEYSKVVLHVSYTARYIFETGEDVAQVFRQFWGSDWESPVKNIEGVFVFPEDIKPLKIYTHPKTKVESSGNTYKISISKFPPYSFAEARFIFNPVNLKYSVKSAFTMNEIERIEQSYLSGYLIRKILLITIYVVFILMLIMIYASLGKEHNISYQAIYEREIPFRDSPDIVNSIVKNLTGKVDQDGMASIIMSLYKKNYIDFIQKNKNKRSIFVKKEIADNDLAPSEKAFLELLVEFSRDKVFDFEQLKKEFKRSTTKARRFTSKLRKYENTVAREVKKRKYLSNTGNVLAKIVAVIIMLLAVVLKEFVPKFPYNDTYDFYFIMSLIYWISGSFVLVLPRSVFGRWTKIGREYYLKWKNFAKFLTDFSTLSQHPPESIILWEDYLIYATALGIADKVEKNLKKLVPEEIWEQESEHPYIYYMPMSYLRSEFSSLRSVAVSSTSSTSSGSGGSSAGGAGGGSGGGGGGAF